MAEETRRKGRPRCNVDAFADLVADPPSDVLSFAEWQRQVCMRLVGLVGTKKYSSTLAKELKAIVRVANQLLDPALRAEAAGMVDSSLIDATDSPPEAVEEAWIWQLWRLRDDALKLLSGERTIQNRMSAQLRDAILTACAADPPQDRFVAQQLLLERRRHGHGGPQLEAPADVQRRSRGIAKQLKLKN